MDKRSFNCVNLFVKVCSRETRNLTEANIQKIVKKGLGTEGGLNTTMKICSFCRLSLSRYSKPMSDDESSSRDEEVISAINLEIQAEGEESLATVPSAESVGSHIAEFSQRVNIEIFNNAMPAISTSPIDL